MTMIDEWFCGICGDYARDCNCNLCPDCEHGIRGDQAECMNCGYEVDED